MKTERETEFAGQKAYWVYAIRRKREAQEKNDGSFLAVAKGQMSV
jgi:hypothetical protein